MLSFSECGQIQHYCHEFHDPCSNDKIESSTYPCSQESRCSGVQKIVSERCNARDALNFNLLPTELQAQIIDSLGSDFFCEDVKRLTISQGWYPWALRTMYYDMTISRVACSLASYEDMESVVSSECMRKRKDNLERNLQIVRLRLDQMYRTYQFVPEKTDLRQYKKERNLLGRRENSTLETDRNQRHDGAKKRSPNPTSLTRMAIMSCNFIYQIICFPKIHTLDLRVKEAWGFYRGQVSGLEAVLCDTLVKKQLTHLYLDLSGLARRKDPRLQRAMEITAGLNDPLPLRHMIRGNERDMLGGTLGVTEPWADRHVCSSIMHALPHLETLHYRSRCICPGIFRWQYPEQVEQWRDIWPLDDGWPVGASYTEMLDKCKKKPDSPLPKLKEVIVNMALPRESLRHKRVVHCMTFDSRLTREAENHYADYAVEEMKREISRLVNRLENPKIVRLRYSRMRGRKVDRNFIDEFDALTGKTRQRAIDKWGEVTDPEV